MKIAAVVALVAVYVMALVAVVAVHVVALVAVLAVPPRKFESAMLLLPTMHKYR